MRDIRSEGNCGNPVPPTSTGGNRTPVTGTTDEASPSFSHLLYSLSYHVELIAHRKANQLLKNFHFPRPAATFRRPYGTYPLKTIVLH